MNRWNVKEEKKRKECNLNAITSIFKFKCISVSSCIFSRYTGASAAVNTWDQQEDDRGSGGLLRILGKGASPLEYN